MLVQVYHYLPTKLIKCMDWSEDQKPHFQEIFMDIILYMWVVHKVEIMQDLLQLVAMMCFLMNF